MDLKANGQEFLSITIGFSNIFSEFQFILTSSTFGEAYKIHAASFYHGITPYTLEFVGFLRRPPIRPRPSSYTRQTYPLRTKKAIPWR